MTPIIRPKNPSWLFVFSAHACAIIAAGLVLGLVFRAYIYWSVQDTIDKARQNLPAKARD